MLQVSVMLKFDFSLLTRDGQKVDSVVIAGIDHEDAERKLRQMYRYSEIVSCNPIPPGMKVEPSGRVLFNRPIVEKQAQVTSLEDILTLISK
jgi:hypothetical protein